MSVRDPRTTVTLQAQMRLERGWAVVWVHNLSRQGMMLWSSRPPRPGAYIELRRATTTIIARAVWVRNKYFGIRTEEPLDVRGLMSSTTRAPDLPPRAARPPFGSTMTKAESHSRRGELRASLIDFGLVAISLSIAVGVAALLEYRTLASIAQLIGAKLTGGP